MNARASITLRPVTEADNDFLLSVYSSTRSQEMQQVPWTPEQKQVFVKMQWQAQTLHYAAEYPAAEHSIILVEGGPAGRLYLDRKGEAFHILDITVLPKYRNAGAGGSLLRMLMSEAGQVGKSVTIHVESFNPSLRLFERLGFRKARETGFHYLMQWSPEA